MIWGLERHYNASPSFGKLSRRHPLRYFYSMTFCSFFRFWKVWPNIQENPWIARYRNFLPIYSKSFHPIYPKSDINDEFLLLFDQPDHKLCPIYSISDISLSVISEVYCAIIACFLHDHRFHFRSHETDMTSRIVHCYFCYIIRSFFVNAGRY